MSPGLKTDPGLTFVAENSDSEDISGFKTAVSEAIEGPNNSASLESIPDTDSLLARAHCQLASPLLPAGGDSTPPAAGPSTPAKWRNCLIGNPQKAISPNPKIGGTSAQIWNLPNLEGVYKMPSITINASTTEVESDCMKLPEEAPKSCNAKINNLFPANTFPSHSPKGITDNTKCLGFPVQCFALFMPHKDDSI
ncbi:hypothetical protein DSO57_1008734 [Entomophthora muscae]|uniref:Uncharacterized protein n=1 Tax=Entomophthora muscae TaxID=34485 RepID=A0ACC2TIY2_9FUNG|nr:hypothetical protein DSO57_1008734 [Entomophthora muscae]